MNKVAFLWNQNHIGIESMNFFGIGTRDNDSEAPILLYILKYSDKELVLAEG